MSTSQELRTAIVGGGVSGLYAAWRLVSAGHDPTTLAVFESSGRTGGRLWSEWLHDEATLAAELGGMFFSDSQPLVFGLCDRVFDLDREPIQPQPDFAWLRARRFRVEEFADTGKLPYRLAPDEQNLSYHQLMFLAVKRMAPAIGDHWPANPEGSREASLQYLRGLEFDGRPLYQWGFWNLLSRVLSNEAWMALRDMVSSHTLFANWNGYDALVSIVLEQAGHWYRLTGGYQQLPDRLARALEQAGVRVLKHHPVHRIVHSGRDLGLHVHNAEGRVGFSAQQVVLALPRHALTHLVSTSPDLADSGLADHLDAVNGIPACKIFLTFDRPWWREVPDGPGQVRRGTYGVSHTDLPLRQCYYLGVDHATGQGLMLASYADGKAVAFWQALMEDAGRDGQLRSELGAQARKEVCRQLSEMHGVTVPQPNGGVFINWTRPPYGGGWHNWQPGWKSWEVTAAMRRPVADLALHVCGEAYSAAQGWVQGALESAEIMLQQEFGLAGPDWLDDSQYLAPYRLAG